MARVTESETTGGCGIKCGGISARTELLYDINIVHYSITSISRLHAKHRENNVSIGGASTGEQTGVVEWQKGTGQDCAREKDIHNSSKCAINALRQTIAHSGNHLILCAVEPNLIKMGYAHMCCEVGRLDFIHLLDKRNPCALHPSFPSRNCT